MKISDGGRMDYQMITGEPGHCQKVLNQWKNIYVVTVLSMVHDHVNNKLIILVMREKKCE